MKLKYSFAFLELDDELAAVPIGSDDFTGILKVNNTAASILKLLNDETDEKAVVQELLKEYKASEEDLTIYVHQFVGQLQDAGLME